MFLEGGPSSVITVSHMGFSDPASWDLCGTVAGGGVGLLGFGRLNTPPGGPLH